MEWIIIVALWLLVGGLFTAMAPRWYEDTVEPAEVGEMDADAIFEALMRGEIGPPIE